MITSKWYNLYNLDTFEDEELTSKSLEFLLGNFGLKTVLLVKGNLTSIVYDGVMLSINMSGLNPYTFEGYAVYLDDNNDIWLGIQEDDEDEE